MSPLVSPTHCPFSSITWPKPGMFTVFGLMSPLTSLASIA